MKKMIILLFIFVIGLTTISCNGYEVIETHNHNICELCDKCTSKECDGLEEEKCLGHNIDNHLHTLCEECGKCILDGCSCQVDEKCHIMEPEVFFPVDNNKSNLEGFVDEFYKQEFENYDYWGKNYWDSYNEYNKFYNLIPQELSDKYEIALVKLEKHNTTVGEFSDEWEVQYYVYYNNKITKLLNCVNSPDKCFVHLAITDYNHDGKIELLMTYYQGKNNIHMFMFDTATNTEITYSKQFYKPENGTYLFFKYDENNELAVYKSITNDINEANTLFWTISSNFNTFTIVNNNLVIENELYKAEIIIDNKYTNFPIKINSGSYQFYVTVIFEYFGEDIRVGSEYNCFKELDVYFTSEDEELKCQKIYIDHGWGPDDYILETGGIAIKSFFFEENMNDVKLGEYQLNLKFFEEITTLDNCIVIEENSKLQTQEHKHTPCQECGKCISEECNGLEEDKCKGCVRVNVSEKTYVSHLDSGEYWSGVQNYIINTYEEFLKFVNENSLMEIQFGEYVGATNLDYYDDLYFSAFDDYDEEYFEQNSLILVCFLNAQSRQNPCIAYDAKYENQILTIFHSVCADSFTTNFKGIIFYSVEISKFVLNDLKDIEYLGDKWIIID